MPRVAEEETSVLRRRANDHRARHILPQALASRLQPLTEQDVQPSKLASSQARKLASSQARKLASSQARKCREARRVQARVRRDPATYLAVGEDRLLKFTLLS